jgi:tetratricopeptide (TPR) repeat protein
MKFSVTTALSPALAVQVELELGDVDQDIEEMADLCNELLDSDISTQSLTSLIMDFARAINLNFNEPFEWKIRSVKVIDCLRKAIVRLPDLHQVSIVLARSLNNRFVAALLDDDYEEGMAILDRILTFCGPGDGPSPYRKYALCSAAMSAKARFDVYRKPENLEHAIYRYRALLDEPSIEGPDRALVIELLSYLEGLRLHRTANTQDASSIPPESAKLPSFRDTVASFSEPMAVGPTSKICIKHLDALRAYCSNQLTDMANIEDGIKYCRQLLVSYPRSGLTSVAQLTFGNLLNRAFERTHKIGYLNEAILATRGGINTADSLYTHVPLLLGLIILLSTRLELLYREEDFHELMQLFPTAPDYSSVHAQDQPPISFYWRLLHAVLDTPLPRPRMTVPCCRFKNLSHSLRHLTNSIPGSSQHVVDCRRFR